MPVYDYFVNNWTSDVKVETLYQTDVAPSFSKVSEDRRALADRPTRTVSFRWDGVTQAEAQRLTMFLMRMAHQRVYVPLYCDVTYTTQGEAPGAVSILCDTTTRRFVTNRYVGLIDRDLDGRILKIQTPLVDGVNAGSLHTAAAMQAFGAGAQVIPLMLVEVVLDGLKVQYLSLIHI